MGKKILVFANNSGGLYDFRKELIFELVKSGNKVKAYTPFDIKVDELRELGIEVIETPLNRRGMNPITDFGLFKRYKQILKYEKPDLVITYTIKPNVYGGFACRLAKVPYVVNITGLGTAFQKKGLLRNLVTVMYKAGCKNAKTVFFENEGNRLLFVNEGIVKDSQTHRLNGAGVNLEHFSLQEFPNNTKTKFLFIGRLMKEKGVDELFSAMSQLIKDGIKAELHVLGGYEEGYKGTIEKYEKAGWLIYHGYQNDVRPFIKECDCFVLPSWHEGMANTNLESAASGRPVITSNIHGCKEAVEEGISGFLCESKNSEDLYKIMKRFTLLSFDVRRTMGVAGRKHMEEVYDKKKVVEDTIRYL